MAYLKDNTGVVIGILRENKIYNAHGVYLGMYNPSSDCTFDSRGRRVGSGNLLTTLL